MSAAISWSKANSLAESGLPSQHPFNPQVPYNNYGGYLKKLYGEKVYRIGVDGGFSCPNRGVDRRDPGCTFCPGDGARSPYVPDEINIHSQIQQSLEALKYKPGAPAILYFQAYTSTYGPITVFKKMLSQALSSGDFKEVIFSTRPDCLGEEVLETIRQLVPEDREVWIELGLQSAHNCTLERMNRGHSWEDFQEAAMRVKARGFKLAAHVILGLPGEGPEEWKATIKGLVPLGIDGIKVHNLLVIKGTPLWEEWQNGEITVYDRQAHLQACLELLPLMPPQG
jgi:radical SAM protein (TIGR01212 family)